MKEGLASVGGVLSSQPRRCETAFLRPSILAMMLQRLGANGHELPRKLRSFIDRQWSRPSVQKWVTLERPAYQPN